MKPESGTDPVAPIGAQDAAGEAPVKKRPVRTMRDEVKGELRIQQLALDPFEGKVTFSVVEGKTTSAFGFQKRRNFATANLRAETLDAFFDLRGNPDEPVVETIMRFLHAEFDATLDQPTKEKASAKT